MNKAIRIAVAAVFGVAATVPAFADFENYGPSTKQHQEITSLQEVNPPALDSNPTNALDNSRSDRRHFRADNQFRSDSQVRSDQMASGSQPRSERRDNYSADGRYIGPHDRFGSRAVESTQHSKVYGGVSEPGSMSEPGMMAGQFRWEDGSRS